MQEVKIYSNIRVAGVHQQCLRCAKNLAVNTELMIFKCSNCGNEYSLEFLENITS